MTQINLGTQTYQSRATPLLNERTVNFYSEKSPPEAKNSISLIGTPGLTLFSDIGTDPVFGVHSLNDILYAVVGNNFYSIDSAGVETNIGSLGIVTDSCQLFNNGFQIMIIKPDTTAWVYTIASMVLAQVTDVDFPGATTGAYLAGLGIVSKPNSGQFWWSATLDLTDWDALSFATAESSPDNLVAVYSMFGQLWLFGEMTTEIWYSTGNADNPFQRVNNGVIQKGCIAKASLANTQDAIYWLGDDLTVYSAQGFSAQRVSNHGIEKIIGELNVVTDGIGFVYTQEGHQFYCLTFPSDRRTFCFDTVTGLWHERESFTLGRWRANNLTVCYNKILVGDFQVGKIYELDFNVYTENGDIIRRSTTFPPIWSQNQRITFDTLFIDFESGVGLEVGQGSDPQAMLDWSDNGGFTFSNEHWRPMGKAGEYLNRATWRRLGTARQRMFRVTVTDPVRTNIQGAYVDTRTADA